MVELQVNGQRYQVEPAGRRLLAVLRDELELLGTKLACGEGACGACAVLLDGKPVNACLLLAEAAAGHEIVTIEGLSGGRAAAVQQAFVAEDASQCGFCTPGQVVSATALLERVPDRRGSRSTRRWQGTSAAAAPIQRSSARSSASPVGRMTARFVDPEGDGGPLRGRLGARGRGGRRADVGARRRALPRRAAGAALRRDVRATGRAR